jgi:hypothetical protein
MYWQFKAKDIRLYRAYLSFNVSLIIDRGAKLLSRFQVSMVMALLCVRRRGAPHSQVASFMFFSLFSADYGNQTVPTHHIRPGELTDTERAQ